MSQSIAKALTVAGSDSGGCAGIQADLKTFLALGVHGMSVIASVTAQDTAKVHAAEDLSLETIRLQFQAVAEDIGIDAAKTGMLSSAAIIGLVADLFDRYGVRNLIVDPVMVSTGGDPLIQPKAIEAMKAELLPQALLATPNRREAEVLSEVKIDSEDRMAEAADRILDCGPRAVIIKGGHFGDQPVSVDCFFDGQRSLRFQAERIETPNTHGSGCTFASAIAAYLARGLDLVAAIEHAKRYVTEAIRKSLAIGKGHGPLDHFWEFRSSA